jgi:hypothetical protein
VAAGGSRFVSSLFEGLLVGLEVLGVFVVSTDTVVVTTGAMVKAAVGDRDSRGFG